MDSVRAKAKKTTLINANDSEKLNFLLHGCNEIDLVYF